MGQLLVITKDPNIDEKDPMADPTVERRGVLAAVIITAGNGHLLGLPDPRVYVGKDSNNNWNATNDIVRVPADVPMFFNPGDVVFIDHNAKGRALKIGTRELRICNQIDVLSKINGIRLMRVNGEWQEAVEA
jgi:hypothetical protein